MKDLQKKDGGLFATHSFTNSSFNANQVEAESGVLYSNSRLRSRIPELNMIYFCLDSVEKIRV